MPRRLLELLLWAPCLAMARHSYTLPSRHWTGTDTWAPAVRAVRRGGDSTDTSPALPHSIGRIRFHPSLTKPAGRQRAGRALVLVVVYGSARAAVGPLVHHQIESLHQVDPQPVAHWSSTRSSNRGNRMLQPMGNGGGGEGKIDGV